jgi:hypothetical protein
MKVKAPFAIKEWKDKSVPTRRKPFVWSVYALSFCPWHSEEMKHYFLIHVLRVSRQGVTERT